MSIEAHKCNTPGCKGFVVFENADFDFNDIPMDEKHICYAFERPICSECGKEYLVIPHYIVIDLISSELGEFVQIESACMTEFEKRQKELKYGVV